MTMDRGRVVSAAFGVVLAGVVVGAWFVAQAAQDAILDSQAGAVVEMENDPSAPGFRAFTEPTPTAAVLHTTVTADGIAELRSVHVLIANAAGGGTIVTVHPNAAIDPALPTLEERFRDDGLLSTLDGLQMMFGVGFVETVVLDAASWTTLMQKDLPLTLSLRSDLIEIDRAGNERVLVGEGSRPFELDEVAIIASHRNPGEAPSGLAERHRQIWQAWISRTAAADEPPPLFRVGQGFVELVALLASEEVVYVDAHTQGDAQESGEVDVPALFEVMESLVPSPRPPVGVADLTVMLLDGTGGETDLRGVAHSVTRLGATVAIVGNTDAIRAETTLRVHAAEGTEPYRQAAALAEVLDVPVVNAPSSDTSVVATMEIGMDGLDAP